MDLRPHRRFVVPFTPDVFEDAAAMSEFVSDHFSCFGVACFAGDEMPLSVESLRRMCDSLGLKLMLDCTESVPAGAALQADYVILPRDGAVPHVRRPGCIVLASCSLSASFPGDAWGGSACLGPDVAALRSVMPDGVILCVRGDAADAVKDGANLVCLGRELLQSKGFEKEARALAERVRANT